jgi:hypothetical protein
MTFEKFKENNYNLCDEIAGNEGLHIKDDFEKIEEILYEQYYIPKYGEDPNY